MAYDAAGRETGLTDPVGNHTTWAYDDADRLTTLTSPNGSTTTYVYDNANELTDTTDPNGRRVTFAYDSGGRQTGETWVGASPAETITSTYDADGELTAQSDGFATLTYTYDSGGRQITAATSSPGGQPSVTLTSGYDPSNNRATLADNLASAGLTTFSYDLANRLTTIAASYGGASGPQVAFGYDAGNRMTSESRTIGGAGTQVNTTFSYDNANRVTAITHGSAVQNYFPPGWITTPLATYAYGYDSGGRVTAETNAEGSVTYSYDNANQLSGVSGARAETYTYDSNGNRTMTGYATTTGNELTTGGGYTYTYDNAGNLTGKTQLSTGDVWTDTWDFRNRLTGVVEHNSGGGVLMQGTYTYDPQNRRIGVDETVSGVETKTWTVYDGVNPYGDFNGSGTLQERYLYGPAVDEILARTSSGGTTAWYLTDRLGTIRDIADTSGTVLDHIAYDSYGNPTSESNPANGDKFKFDGMQFDAAVNEYYDNARWYDPASGRFISIDPRGFAAGDANLYRYVGNSPINVTDPSGLIGIFFDGAGQPSGRNTVIQNLYRNYWDGSGAVLYTNIPFGFNLSADPVGDAMGEIVKARRSNPCEPVDIFGWSRGGYYGLMLAQKLNERGIPVRFLGLIDPVSNPVPAGIFDHDRPSNVQNLWQGWASANAGSWIDVFANHTIFSKIDIYGKLDDFYWYQVPHSQIGFLPTVFGDMKQSAQKCGVNFNPPMPPKGGSISITETR